MNPKPAGLILAAGASRRMGGQAKALLETTDGETFLARMIRILAAYCDPVVTVVAPGRTSWVSAPSRAVVNPDPDRGMLSSLQCGLASLDARRVLFTPVDLPSISPATVEAVANAPGEIVIPRAGEHGRGHPVCISPAVVRELMDLDSATGKPNQVMQRDPSRIHYLEVGDIGIVSDVDHPHEYSEYLALSAVKAC